MEIYKDYFIQFIFIFSLAKLLTLLQRTQNKGNFEGSIYFVIDVFSQDTVTVKVNKETSP